MARHPRAHLAHVYMPRRRTAYGRRAGSHGLVEELHTSRWIRVHCAGARGGAEEATHPLAGVQQVAVPMPRGGLRWLLVCPGCGRHVTRLYSSALSRDDQVHLLARCRLCLGVHYWSQREGRRPEAAPERVEALRHAARRTRDPQVRRRRLERVGAVEALRTRREQLHDHRRRVALRHAILPALERALVHQRRVWLDALLVALHAPLDMRAVLALRFAVEAERAATKQDIGWRWPVWAAEVLRATLVIDAEEQVEGIVERVDVGADDGDTAEQIAARTGVPVPSNVVTLEEVEAYRVRFEARRRQAQEVAMLQHGPTRRQRGQRAA